MQELFLITPAAKLELEAAVPQTPTDSEASVDVTDQPEVKPEVEAVENDVTVVVKSDDASEMEEVPAVVSPSGGQVGKGECKHDVT